MTYPLSFRSDGGHSTISWDILPEILELELHVMFQPSDFREVELVSWGKVGNC